MPCMMWGMWSRCEISRREEVSVCGRDRMNSWIEVGGSNDGVFICRGSVPVYWTVVRLLWIVEAGVE